MQAVILAGGLGTRLREKIKKIPKPMIKIGGLPLLEHQINLLKRYNIKEIFILTCYLSEVIEKYFRDGRNFGVSITYFKEKNPLGTTGGVKEIEDKLNNNFIVIYGDVMIDMDISKMLAFHKKKNSECTLVLHPNDHPYDSDLVEIDSNQKIIAFHPKPHSENEYFRNLVNAGLYIVSSKILRYIKRGVKADFAKDIFPKIVKKAVLYGYNTAEYLKDVGVPERIVEVRRDYFCGKITRFNRHHKRRAIFMDRDGVINKKIGLIYKIEDFELIPSVGKAIKKINDSEFLAIVITNQPVVARNLCSIKELETIHKKLETLLGEERAKLDAIYYCPHHPDKGFPEENPKYKIKCNCRKPKTGLIEKAKRDFNIDLKKSYFIGDSFRDILCGKNAGLRTIGVKTGDGLKDDKIKPDYLFTDLYKAVNFITNLK